MYICLFKYLNNCGLCHLLVDKGYCRFKTEESCCGTHIYVNEDNPKKIRQPSVQILVANREVGVGMLSVSRVHNLAVVPFQSWLGKKALRIQGYCMADDRQHTQHVPGW